MQLIRNLYNYRELLKTNIKKEIRGKYKGSALGILWSFINPLLQCAVYAIVFPFIMRDGPDNFLIYLICGIIPWTYFTTVIGQGCVTIRANAGIIKKVYFPREILPISVVLSGLVNFMISCVIILAFVVFGGLGISWHLILLPLIAFFQSFFSLGLAFILSALNIYIKDTEYIVGFILNMAFYATPILYSPTSFGGIKLFEIVFKLNPMATYVNAYRDIFMYHQLPDMNWLIITGIASIVLSVVGYFIFKKLEKGFAEEI